MRCYACGRDTDELFDGRYGSLVCQRCFDEMYAHCADCGTLCDRHTRYQNDDSEQLCHSCWARTFTWRPTVVSTRGPSDRVGSGRCFGLELETSACDGYKDIRNQIVFGAKQDCSVDGMEFDSPILHGNRGLDHVRQFCKLARKMGFRVDRRCGFHIHMDMRRTTKKQRHAIIYAYRLTYKIWESMVCADRRNKSWCHAPDSTLAEIREIDDIDEYCYDSDRYEFVNCLAYATHGTFEIRGYQGTLNAVVICNWIRAHLRFVDAVQDKSLDELDELFGKPRRALQNLRRIIGATLSRFYACDWRLSNLTRQVSMV